MNKVIPQKLGWVKVKKITIKVTNRESKGVHFRIYRHISLRGKLIEMDMFPCDPDFLVSVNGTISIESNANFKMKSRLSVT